MGSVIYESFKIDNLSVKYSINNSLSSSIGTVGLRKLRG